MDVENEIDKIIDADDKKNKPVSGPVDHVVYNNDGTVAYIKMKDGTRVSHRLFREIFLNTLRFNIAGETLTPYYYRDYQKRITPQTFATHLQNVEAQARVDQMKLLNLTGKQKMAIGAIILILIFAIFGFMILTSTPWFQGG